MFVTYSHWNIGIVEIMMDEVDGRSYKEGYRVQVVQYSRDEVSTKLGFEKLPRTSLCSFKT